MAGLAAAVPLVPRLRLGPGQDDALLFPEAGPAGLGRATTWGVSIYEKPQQGAARLGALDADDVVTIYAEVPGDPLFSHNALWYETEHGFVYSSFVQPIENSPQVPIASVPESGLLAEVSVPYVQSHTGPGEDDGRDYRLYYGTVYRVLSVEPDAGGRLWYGLDDAGGFRIVRYVPAEGLRIVRPEDLAPLAPGADKYIHVSIGQQLLEAYEGTRKVFEARVASGTVFNVGGKYEDFTTPLGRHRVLRKRPSSHMTGGTRGASDYYDLPGVPFVTYFTPSAAAVHGTFWHNDYGHPRSHGCVNVLPHQARWVYRWTEPYIPYDHERLDIEDNGTIIEVEA
jgi:hypothetical protein